MVHHTPKPATLTPPPPHTAHTDFAKHTGVDRTMNGALGREEDGREACANCDKHESDIVKLKNCNACFLVKYCSVDCQKAHRKQHKKACKQRAAELKDEQLYSQGHERPECNFCPICTLLIPLPMGEHSRLNTCCMKKICKGCIMASRKRGMFDCPFCRSPLPNNDADMLALVQARIAKKDPVAINHLGDKYFYGKLGLQKDMRKAVELWTEAAELGSIDTLFNLGFAYYYGRGVGQNLAKGVEFYKKAAMRGCAVSRFFLGSIEGNTGNFDAAHKHWLISAKMGYREPVDKFKSVFMLGIATKEQYAGALKGYQEAVEEMRSHDRDEAVRLGF